MIDEHGNCNACGFDLELCTCDGDDADVDQLATALAGLRHAPDAETRRKWIEIALKAGASADQIGVTAEEVADVEGDRGGREKPLTMVTIDGVTITGDPAISLLRDGELD